MAQVVAKSIATASNNAQSGQVSGKYYRTRSLSQNLQQIFHPNRQSHSRSINNLSAVGGTARLQIDASNNNINNNNISNFNINNQKMIDEKLNVPQSLPQSPRIQIETPDQFIIPNSYDSYKMNHSKSLNFSPSLSRQSTQYQYGSPPSIYSNNSSISSHNRVEFVPSAKLKGYNLGGYRRNQYTRSLSMEVPKQLKPLQKRPSWEERRGSNSSNNQDSSYSDNQYQINEVVKENVELLRKYSDPKIHGYLAHPQEPSSLSLLQSTFKAKLASLFKNKKKYTIMEPASGKENSGNEMYSMNRYNSAQSLPALVSSTAQQQKKQSKQQKKKQKSKKISVEKYGCDGKLKKLNLNPPQMIGGSFDNLLLINRMNKKKDGLGPYGTYHGRPLLSHAARLKALYKYRKPSESDDATTLSFDYDSGDISDASSLVQSSDDIDEEMSSSYSDFTNKSGSQAYQIRSSASVNSMPPLKFKRHETKKHLTPMRSPVSSSELQGTPQLPMLNLDAFNNNNISSSNTYSSNFSSGSRMFNMPATYTKFNTVPHQHQAAPYNNPFNRNDYSMTMPMMHHQYSSYNTTAVPTKPLFLASFASSSTSTSYNAQMIKNFFTSGPGSSPLVSFLSLSSFP